MMAWLRRVFGHTDPETEQKLAVAMERNTSSTNALRDALRRIDGSAQ